MQRRHHADLQEFQLETRCGNALVASMLIDIAHRIEHSDKRLPFNFDKDLFGFNLTEHGVKNYNKSFKIGPFQQTINANLGNGHVHGTTSVPGTGLSKLYCVRQRLARLDPREPDWTQAPCGTTTTNYTTS